MSNKNTQPATMFPILGILGLIFITLKLTGHITWSWWFVTMPFWGIPVAFITGAAIAGVIGLIVRAIK